jgi:NDP-sugar pyrophosphorylase family protein
VIGPRCRVGKGADVRESVLLDGSSVGEDACVVDSILAGAEAPAGMIVEGVVAGEGERLPA